MDSVICTPWILIFSPGGVALVSKAVKKNDIAGCEGRTGAAGDAPQCLTLLSDPTRKLAFSSGQGSKTARSPQQNSRALKDGPGLPAMLPSA